MMVTSRLQNSRIGNHNSGTPGTLKRLEIPDIFLVCNIEFQSKLRLFLSVGLPCQQVGGTQMLPPEGPQRVYGGNGT